MKAVRTSLLVVVSLVGTAILSNCSLHQSEPDFTVYGVVRDAATGRPISGAIVSDGKYGPDPKKFAATDAQGSYAYQTWYEEHTVLAEAFGYHPQNRTLTTKFLSKEEEKEVNFSLDPVQ